MMDGRESVLDNNVFYACGLIEYIGRKTRNERGMVVGFLGRDRIAHMVEYADVLHSENIDAVCERYVDDAQIPYGDFDNVSSARYGTPTHWDMGKVYKRLALGIMQECSRTPADAIVEAFCSPIAPLIDDYNGSFFYEAPANILTAHLTGVIE
ncbi:MAG: hypothetical protein Q4A01_04315 [Coriobacteriales bacterium]|nr:hypothetical protein [Coriobacteriales bacterium]